MRSLSWLLQLLFKGHITRNWTVSYSDGNKNESNVLTNLGSNLLMVVNGDSRKCMDHQYNNWPSQSPFIYRITIEMSSGMCKYWYNFQIFRFAKCHRYIRLIIGMMATLHFIICNITVIITLTHHPLLMSDSTKIPIYTHSHCPDQIITLNEE